MVESRRSVLDTALPDLSIAHDDDSPIHNQSATAPLTLALGKATKIDRAKMTTSGQVFPKYWSDFIEKFELIGKEVSMHHDYSFIIFDETAALYEMTELVPGVLVKDFGFIPVGACSYGTGDGYFINSNDGAGGPLYQVDHEGVFDSENNRKRNMTIAMDDFEKILKCKIKTP